MARAKGEMWGREGSSERGEQVKRVEEDRRAKTIKKEKEEEEMERQSGKAGNQR